MSNKLDTDPRLEQTYSIGVCASYFLDLEGFNKKVTDNDGYYQKEAHANRCS